MRRGIYKNYDFELSEIADFPGDPAPRMLLEWLTRAQGGGRCSCGRCLPAVTAAAELEEEQAISLIRAIIGHYEYRAARRVRRAVDKKKVHALVERTFARELAFLQRWEAELSGADPASEF